MVKRLKAKSLKKQFLLTPEEIEAFLAEKTSATIDEDYIISPSYRAISEDDTRFDHNFCVEDALSYEQIASEGRKNKLEKDIHFLAFLFQYNDSIISNL